MFEQPQSSLELPFDLVNGSETPSAHVRNALQVLQLLAGDSALDQLDLAARLSLRQLLLSITKRLQAAAAQLELGDRRVATLSALLDAGGLEFVPRGTTARDRELLARCADVLDAIEGPSDRALRAELSDALAAAPLAFLESEPAS